MVNKLSIGYIVGLLNTDGSFYVDFKSDKSMSIKYALRPVVQINQQNLDLHILEEIEETLLLSNISSFIDVTRGPNLRKRAPRLKVQGIENVQKFLHLLEKSNSKLFGLKLVDYLLLKQIYTLIDDKSHNTESGRKKIIDLKMSFHEPPVLPSNLEKRFLNRNLPKRKAKEKPPANRYKREVWEEKHGFQKDSTKSAGKDKIVSVYQAYYEHCNQVLGGVKVQTEFVKGILDGDGCVFNSSKTDVDFQITLDNGNEQLFIALADFFSDEQPCVYGRPGSQVYVVRRETLVSKFRPLLASLRTHKRRTLPT